MPRFASPRGGAAPHIGCVSEESGGFFWLSLAPLQEEDEGQLYVSSFLGARAYLTADGRIHTVRL